MTNFNKKLFLSKLIYHLHIIYIGIISLKELEITANGFKMTGHFPDSNDVTVSD